MTLLNSLTTSFGHRQWTHEERIQLTIAYNNGACLKTMSRILNRSVSAINKALSRFGLRSHFGTRRDQGNEWLKNRPSEEEIRASIHAYCQKFLIDSFVEDQASKSVHQKEEKPFCGLPLLESSVSGRRVFRKTDIVVKFDQVLKSAQKLGMEVKKLNHPHLNAQGYLYLLNNQPVTKSQLLMKINIERREKKLPIFYVRGITCYK
jgi:hypothetical protein